MGTFSIWHWLIVLAVVLLLFGGRGKISQIMGDFGKGLKSFKKGIKDDEEEASASAQRVSDGSQATPSNTTSNATADAQKKPD